MIDITRCEYEESFVDDDCNCTVHYFIYPKSLDETNFCAEEEYGNVKCMCISLTAYDDGGYSLQMSPTVEYEDELFDVDWRALHIDTNFTEETVLGLLGLVPKNV